MSKTNSLAKIGGVEIVTGINFIGLCYIYYEIQKLGAELTQHIKDVTTVVKTVGSNINVIHQHFTAHLIHHKNVLDIDSRESLDDSSEDTDNHVSKEALLSRIERLEERLNYIESVSNPILSSPRENKSSFKVPI